MPEPKDTISTIIPTMRYNDAKAAIDWLCGTFGFTRHLVVESDDGKIAHAQLKFGNGMIMLGSARDDEFGSMQCPPTNSGAVTQSPYIVVADIDQLYTSAKSAGATIVIEIKDEDYGGRVFSCRDPQGQLWNFGSYDPWQPEG
ncbi:MAG TPA: glyoxalase [Planctomycetaceae bacterium]|nr:glyoxalase [Planctomycetaceae bacterium]